MPLLHYIDVKIHFLILVNSLDVPFHVSFPIGSIRTIIATKTWWLTTFVALVALQVAGMTVTPSARTTVLPILPGLVLGRKTTIHWSHWTYNFHNRENRK